MTRLFDDFRARPKSPITPRIALELIAHEAIVPECYLDSAKPPVWTWSVGITNASGHKVYPRYLDKPQPLHHCIGVYLWLLEHHYLPDVIAAFKGHELTESELGGALSFHYNTGAILRCSWVRTALAGDRAKACDQMLEWCKPRSIYERRRREAELFFKGKWSATGKAAVYPVKKPSYKPDFDNGKLVDVRPMVEQMLGGR